MGSFTMGAEGIGPHKVRPSSSIATLIAKLNPKGSMGAEGIEPPSGGLEPPVLPLNYAPSKKESVFYF